jgi:hypothetical protein
MRRWIPKIAAALVSVQAEIKPRDGGIRQSSEKP